jgi:hypothetical protein
MDIPGEELLVQRFPNCAKVIAGATEAFITMISTAMTPLIN